jgi:hypothetical protein
MTKTDLWDDATLAAISSEWWPPSVWNRWPPSSESAVSIKPPRQLAMWLDFPALKGMTSTDRNTAVRRLARLLLEAAGADPEEIGDDER